MRMIKSPIFDQLVSTIKTTLSETDKGKEFIRRWSDSQIRNELREPCFFGVKTPIRKEDFAIKHFKRIAGIA